MYPANFFDLFPPFPREKKVFVAMSFDKHFHQRWEEVIEPAVSEIEIDGTPLEPTRVDIRTASDSIVTEILQGIANHLVVFADVSTIAYANGKPVRNANVLYEVGVAHAVRLPEEVILFRSDHDELIFDITNVRVNTYDPENEPMAARSLVRDSIVNSLREVDLTKHLAVRRAAEAMDYPSWMLLVEAQHAGGITHPPMRSMRQAVGNANRVTAIQRLLEIGALRAEFFKVTPENLQSEGHEPAESLLKYHATSFGRAILGESTRQMGMWSPAVASILEERRQQSEQEETP